MKVDIEGKVHDVSPWSLRQMALRGEIHPWFYLKSDELTGGKWVRAKDIQLFSDVFIKTKAPASGSATAEPQVGEREVVSLAQLIKRASKRPEPKRSRKTLLCGQ